VRHAFEIRADEDWMAASCPMTVRDFVDELAWFVLTML
jgi:hypothetical protein